MTTLTPHHTITFQNDASRPLFMSFGLLNQLSGLIGELHNIHLVHTDSGLRDALFSVVLSIRKPDGQIEQAYNPLKEEFQLSIEQGDALLDWVVAHLQDFFLKCLERQLAIQTKINSQINKKD